MKYTARLPKELQDPIYRVSENIMKYTARLPKEIQDPIYRVLENIMKYTARLGYPKNYKILYIEYQRTL